MALKFWLGGEGSDKSRRLIEYILSEADKNPHRQYLFVVPEQYGLATQRALVLGSKNKGILNIDVLSFTRLAHRISDEVGAYSADVTTLDEMGKSLLIGMLATQYKKDLKVLSEGFDKPGYVDRIKSIISEFMQYLIPVEKVNEMAEASEGAGRHLLAAKLKDIAFLYGKFKEYTANRYTTVEETLDMVSSLVPRSDTVRNGVVIFDGFTGFTPIQNKLIGVLMDHATDIHVGLTIEDCIQENNNSDEIKEHELFYLSKKTMNQLVRMADERQILIADSYKSRKNKKDNVCNSNEEQNVYTNNNTTPELNNTAEKHILIGKNPTEEIRLVYKKIVSLIKDRGYRYRDIAILTGDLEGYRHPVERILTKHDIPFFIDRTEPVLLNPFIEYIRAFLGIISDNYSISSVFRFLKSGITDISEDEINALENYCLAANIKGYGKWHTRFDVCTQSAGADELLILNETREKLISRCDMFSSCLLDPEGISTADDISEGTGKHPKTGERHINAGSKFSVKQFCVALYRIIENEGIEDKLKIFAAGFEEEGNRKLASQYSRIYVSVMNVLDELCELIPDESTDVKGFAGLLEAGLDAIRIGTVPTGMDYVQVGDLTRSRFDDIRALFIVGANDGIIPKVSSGSALINDKEREYLVGNVEGLVLAPTSREEVYTQQLYIYMAVSRPSEHLYVSYSAIDRAGRTLLPSYLIGKIRSENPKVTIETGRDTGAEYTDEAEAFEEFTKMVFPALNGMLETEKVQNAIRLMKYFLRNDRYRPKLQSVIEHEILRSGAQAEDTIGAILARAIYGKRISTSITRLEEYAKCAYKYFLEYGLKVRDREIFSVDARDIGNIFHDSMKEYSDLMAKGGYDWSDPEPDTRRKLMDEAVDSVMERYYPRKFSSSARYAYMAGRIRRVMQTSADIVSAQIRKGAFVPKYFEVDFDTLENTDQLNIVLSDDEMMRLRGRIDRVDTCDTDEGIYVRIIDYKSSQHDIDLAAVYEGRQLQLLVYLNVAMEGIRKTSDDVYPAGVLYYHIDDPLVETKEAVSEYEIHRQIMKKLRLCGLVNSDANVLKLMDSDIASDPLVVPVSIRKDGEAKKSKQTVTGEEMEILGKYVEERIRQTGREILSGNISIPEPDGRDRLTGPDCGYCPYGSICAYKIKKNGKVTIPPADDIISHMKTEQ